MSAEAWASPHGMTDRDRERAERFEKKKRELEAILQPILSPEMWSRLLQYGAEPDVHHSCDEYRDRLIEGIALHFGQQAPAIRAIANHVADDHEDVGPPASCGVVVPELLS